ncbi:MAG: hypothetical protein KY455_11250, partial [Euryarchaeota archaeon]|nr:hypothetical protein [Euryarchaeota archaeon]
RSPLEWVVRAMKELDETGSIPVGQPFYNSKSAAADLLPIVWGWTKEVGKLPVTEADIEYAQGMNDPDIQAMLCEFFLNHEAVPADAMGSLEMERDKAHGGAEIADFATKINAAGTTYMVAMPVKSFAEAKGKSSAKLKEAYVYQFARPVLRYGWKHVVSYPIVLAEVTLNTQELATELDFKTRSNVVWISMHMFIKIMKNHNIWPIMDA